MHAAVKYDTPNSTSLPKDGETSYEVRPSTGHLCGVCPHSLAHSTRPSFAREKTCKCEKLKNKR